MFTAFLGQIIILFVSKWWTGHLTYYIHSFSFLSWPSFYSAVVLREPCYYISRRLEESYPKYFVLLKHHIQCYMDIYTKWNAVWLKMVIIFILKISVYILLKSQDNFVGEKCTQFCIRVKKIVGRFHPYLSAMHF